MGHRDERSLSVVGRHARLELAFGYRNGRTVLAEAYAEPPFRVGRCFAEGEGVQHHAPQPLFLGGHHEHVSLADQSVRFL